MATLAPGTSETVTMVVQADSVIEEHLFTDTFQSYATGSQIVTDPGTRWTVDPALSSVFTVQADPTGATSNLVLRLDSINSLGLSNVYSLQYELKAIPTPGYFTGTVDVEYNVLLNSSCHQVYSAMGAGLSWFDSGGTNAGYVLNLSDYGQWIKVRYMWDPVMGSTLVQLFKADGTFISQAYNCETSGLAQPFDLRFVNKSVGCSSQQEAMFIDNVDVNRAIINKAVITADNGGYHSDCNAIKVVPTGGSTPLQGLATGNVVKLGKTLLVSPGAAIATATPSPTPTLTFTSTPTCTPTKTWTPTPTPTTPPVQVVMMVQKSSVAIGTPTPTSTPYRLVVWSPTPTRTSEVISGKGGSSWSAPISTPNPQPKTGRRHHYGLSF